MDSPAAGPSVLCLSLLFIEASTPGDRKWREISETSVCCLPVVPMWQRGNLDPSTPHWSPVYVFATQNTCRTVTKHWFSGQPWKSAKMWTMDTFTYDRVQKLIVSALWGDKLYTSVRPNKDFFPPNLFRHKPRKLKAKPSKGRWGALTKKTTGGTRDRSHWWLLTLPGHN